MPNGFCDFSFLLPFELCGFLHKKAASSFLTLPPSFPTSQAARLCIQVLAGNRTKDTRKKTGTRRKVKDDKKGEQADRPLHWVNMQILDHRFLPRTSAWTIAVNCISFPRALLRHGLLRLNLWPILSDSGVGMSPMGSTAINPDGNNSTVLYMELDSYAHPVACPTGGWGEDIPRCVCVRACVCVCVRVCVCVLQNIFSGFVVLVSSHRRKDPFSRRTYKGQSRQIPLLQ